MDMMKEEFVLDFYRPGRPDRPKFVGRSGDADDGNGGVIHLTDMATLA